jgi:hypothetical protein
MTRTYIAAELRRFAAERANHRCKYYLYPQEASLLACEVERLIAEKHGGPITADTLALACPYCNRFQGSDLGSLDPETRQLTPFYDPRKQRWLDHFTLDGAAIVPQPPEGRVTVHILQRNHPDRLAEHGCLMQARLLP